METHTHTHTHTHIYIYGEGNGNPLQYSCLENLMDKGAWWATVHEVEKSRTTEQLMHTHTHIYISNINIYLG